VGEQYPGNQESVGIGDHPTQAKCDEVIAAASKEWVAEEGRFMGDNHLLHACPLEIAKVVGAGSGNSRDRHRGHSGNQVAADVCTLVLAKGCGQCPHEKQRNGCAADGRRAMSCRGWE
jgi:hypothetical protein